MQTSNRTALLLYRDDHLRRLLRNACPEREGHVLATQELGEALELICAGELDFAVVEFADGCHGMTLLSAIHACRPELPVIVVTADAEHDATAIVYANDVVACLTKPVSAMELKFAIEELFESTMQLTAA